LAALDGDGGRFVMSSQYNIEPLPTGRVLVTTSMGPLDIELFAKETPQTCRSFIQLCLEGYYNNVIFHRIVADFIIQTGDPTGTGTGGEAATSEGTVKDEFHSRLRYTRRGLVGMANSGDKDDNGSQFFITLSATPELERKNSLFGRIAAGDTIYNALRIGALETDALDRPLHPPKIIGAEVIENPFPDIVPRSTEADRQARQRQLEEEKIKATVRKAKKRNKALLSFGDDEPDEGAETIKTKIKSVYDLEGPSSTDPTLQPPSQHPPSVKQPGPKKPQKPAAPPAETIDLTPSEPPATSADTNQLGNSFARPIPIIVDDARSITPPSAPKKPSPPPASIEDQIASLKSQLKSLKNKRAEEEEDSELVSKRGKKSVESEITRYMTSGRAILGKRNRKTRREEDTLSKLTQFQSKILGVERVDTLPPETEESRLEACVLHNVPGCMSCFDRFGEQPDDDDPKSLWGHKLVFAKDVFGKDEKYRQQRQGEDLEVIDPRERMKEFEEQEKRSRPLSKSTKVWRQESGRGRGLGR
jgi:peptidyl-prolyl cis-trans isomerase SDCCAG10